MTLLETKSKSGARRSSTYRRWRLAMKRARHFQPGDRVGVAVSGGADSMLLFEYMREYAREAGLMLAVAHFNHHLRGAESDEDEDSVRAQAQRFKIEFLCSGAPVREFARERKMNIESAARELRYRFLCSLLREGKLDKVATAHTANDQAETVLLRLLRGTGARGLGGIHPVVEVPGGKVVRPFLSLTRAEVEAEVARSGLAFRTDATNLDTSLARNRIRQEVLPLLGREFNPVVVPALAAFADRARADEAFLDDQARQRTLGLFARAGGVQRVDCRRLSELHPAIASRVLRLALEEARGWTLSSDAWDSKPCAAQEGPLSEPSEEHGFSPAVTYPEIESVRRLASDGQSGKRLQLAGRIEARREFEWLVIERVETGVTFARDLPCHGFAYTLQPPCEIAVPKLGVRLHFRLDDGSGSVSKLRWVSRVTDHLDDSFGAQTPGRAYTDTKGVWLDAGRLSSPLILRSWRPGDRVDSPGKARPLKLKDLFQQGRIPIGQRRYWPVLEAGGEVIWARGFEAQFEERAPGRYRLLISEERYQRDAGGYEKK